MLTKRTIETIRNSVEDPVFIALMELLEDSIKTGLDIAIMPNQTPDDRTFNCGRSSALKDFFYEIQNIQLTKEEELN